MKTYEELKGMAHEELIIEVQMLQDSLSKEKEYSVWLFAEQSRLKTKYDNLIGIIKSAITLAE